MSDYVSVTDPSSEREAVQRIREIVSRQEAAAAQLDFRKRAAKDAEAAEMQARLNAIAEQLREIVDAASSEEVRSRDPRRIMASIANRFGVTLANITGADRQPHIVRARWAAIHEVRAAHPDFTIKQLGRHFGGRDHTSILNAIRKMERNGVPQPPISASKRAVR